MKIQKKIIENLKKKYQKYKIKNYILLFLLLFFIYIIILLSLNMINLSKMNDFYERYKNASSDDYMVIYFSDIDLIKNSLTNNKDPYFIIKSVCNLGCAINYDNEYFVKTFPKLFRTIPKPIIFYKSSLNIKIYKRYYSQGKNRYNQKEKYYLLKIWIAFPDIHHIIINGLEYKMSDEFREKIKFFLPVNVFFRWENPFPWDYYDE